MMTLKSLNVLLAATALGVGALAFSSPADAYYRGCGWRTHHRWVYASDYVAPRRSCYDGCGTDYYAAPVVYSSAWPYGYGWGGWGGWGWPF
jgi:hypothetical protein